MYRICGLGQQCVAPLYQHPSTENMMMDGAVSGFSGAVASSRFVGVQLNKVLQNTGEPQKARSVFSQANLIITYKPYG